MELIIGIVQKSENILNNPSLYRHSAIYGLNQPKCPLNNGKTAKNPYTCRISLCNKR